MNALKRAQNSPGTAQNIPDRRCRMVFLPRNRFAGQGLGSCQYVVTIQASSNLNISLHLWPKPRPIVSGCNRQYGDKTLLDMEMRPEKKKLPGFHRLPGRFHATPNQDQR